MTADVPGVAAQIRFFKLPSISPAVAESREKKREHLSVTVTHYHITRQTNQSAPPPGPPSCDPARSPPSSRVLAFCHRNKIKFAMIKEREAATGSWTLSGRVGMGWGGEGSSLKGEAVVQPG